MSLQIQMLGTGSAFSKKYFNNNALIQSNGFTLLVDCGTTASRALHELDIELDQIDGILISHIHADHIGGLEEFSFRYKYGYKKRIPLFLPGALVDNLWEHSLRGGLESPADGIDSLNDYFDIVPLEEQRPSELFRGLTIRLIRTKHVPDKPSYSLLFNDHIFYSADCQFDYSLLVHLYETGQAKYFLHDCQLTRTSPLHASLDELLTLPKAVQQQMLLMHYDDSKDTYIGRTGHMTFMEQHKLYEFP